MTEPLPVCLFLFLVIPLALRALRAFGQLLPWGAHLLLALALGASPATAVWALVGLVAGHYGCTANGPAYSAGALVFALATAYGYCSREVDDGR